MLRGVINIINIVVIFLLQSLSSCSLSHTHTLNRCPLTLIHIKRAHDGRPSVLRPASLAASCPPRQAARLPKHPFVLCGIITRAAKPLAWHAHRRSPRPHPTPSPVTPNRWMGGRGRWGRVDWGVGGLHLSPNSTTPRVSHGPICSQESRGVGGGGACRLAHTNRWEGLGGIREVRLIGRFFKLSN